jgi:hypothetical protein
LRVREQHSLNAQLGETKARPEEDQSGPPAVECPVAEEEEGRSSLRSEGGVLLGLARGGKQSVSCFGGWRRVGAVHIGGVRQWGAEVQRRRQSEGA